MATIIKKRKNKKELDEFISTSEHIFMAISENWEKFAVVVGVLVVAFLGILYANHSKSQKKALMFQEISRIQGKITDANRESAIQELEKVVELNKGIAGGAYGAYILAKESFLSGNLEKGKNILQDIRSQNPSGVYSDLAVLELGRRLELSGKWNEAASQYQTFIDGGPDYAKVEAYLGLARCREETGDSKGAVAAYKEMIQKFPEYDPALEFAKDRVRSLETGIS